MTERGQAKPRARGPRARDPQPTLAEVSCAVVQFTEIISGLPSPPPREGASGAPAPTDPLTSVALGCE